jgi:hypothetical protein
LLISVVGRQTLDLNSLSPPNHLIVAAVAAKLIALAIQRQSTWRALAGTALVTIGMCLDSPELGIDDFWFWQWHVPPLALIALAVIFDDDLARALRLLAWRAVPCLALTAALVYPWTLPDFNPVALAAYLGLLLMASAAFWLRQRRVESLVAVLATILAGLLAQLRPAYVLLDQTVLAGGLPWLAVGLLVVAAAFLISLLKMGAGTGVWRGLNRLNLALGGSTSPSA